MTAGIDGVKGVRIKIGDVLRLRKDVVHPHDHPHGPATFVGLEHIESGTGQRVGSVPVEMSELTGRKPRFYKGDIVYGYLRPYLNKVWIAEFDGLCSVDQYVYEVDRTRADPEFIAWFMRSPVYLERAPIGTTPGQLPRIRTEEVADVGLALPSLHEQRQIVSKLDGIMEAARCVRSASDGRAKAIVCLPSAYLREEFDGPSAEGWTTRPLGDAAEIVSGLALGRSLRSGSTTALPYLRVANVKDGHLDLSDVLLMDATPKELEKCRLVRGDLLLTEGGDADKLGRGALWQAQIPTCIHQNHIFRVRFDPSLVIPEFAAAQVGSAYGKRYFLRHAKQTTGIATINHRVLSAFPLRIPPIAIQKAVVSTIDEAARSVASMLAAVRSETVAARTLSTAILRRAFSGAN